MSQLPQCWPVLLRLTTCDPCLRMACSSDTDVANKERSKRWRLFLHPGRYTTTLCDSRNKLPYNNARHARRRNTPPSGAKHLVVLVLPLDESWQCQVNQEEVSDARR